VQQTASGIDSIRYFVNYGSQKVLLSASGNLASAVTATTFNAPAADSLLAGLSGDLRTTSAGTQMVSTLAGTTEDVFTASASTETTLDRIALISAMILRVTKFVFDCWLAEMGRCVGLPAVQIKWCSTLLNSSPVVTSVSNMQDPMLY
jgi:hypothetical protein